MRLAFIGILTGVLIAPPAFAQQTPYKEPPDPTVAAQWSVLTPLACGLVGTALGVVGGQRGTDVLAPMLVGLGVGLGTVGAGQVYAGDFGRGLAFGAAAYPAVALGAFVGAGAITPFVSIAAGARLDPQSELMLGAAIGGALAAVGFGAFSAYDAQWYAKRVADRRTRDD